MAKFEGLKFNLQHLHSTLYFLQVSHESFMMTMTRRLDALDALMRETQVTVERIDRRMPPPSGEETDSSFD